jgi:hypothetical protein
MKINRKVSSLRRETKNVPIIFLFFILSNYREHKNLARQNNYGIKVFRLKPTLPNRPDELKTHLRDVRENEFQASTKEKIVEHSFEVMACGCLFFFLAFLYFFAFLFINLDLDLLPFFIFNLQKLHTSCTTKVSIKKNIQTIYCIKKLHFPRCS